MVVSFLTINAEVLNLGSKYSPLFHHKVRIRCVIGIKWRIIHWERCQVCKYKWLLETVHTLRINENPFLKIQKEQYRIYNSMILIIKTKTTAVMRKTDCFEMKWKKNFVLFQRMFSLLLTDIKIQRFRQSCFFVIMFLL